MMTLRAVAFALATAVGATMACEREPQPVATPPLPADSAGWRAARVANGAVELRYPTTLMAGIVDRTTPICGVPNVAALVNDTTLGDQLIALNTPQTIDSVASPFGFLRRGGSWWLDPSSAAQGWTGGEEADALVDGEWTRLDGEVTMKLIADEQKIPEGADHLTPQTMHQGRVVAMRPLTAACALALVWQSRAHSTREDSARSATRRTVFRHLLGTVRVKR